MSGDGLMKAKLIIGVFVIAAIVMVAFAFQPTATNVRAAAKPLPTPVPKARVTPKKPKGWLDETSLGTASLERNANTASNTASNSNTRSSRDGQSTERNPPKRQKKNPQAQNFGDTPGLNGGDMMITSTTNVPTNQNAGTPTHVTGIKRKPPKRKTH